MTIQINGTTNGANGVNGQANGHANGANGSHKPRVFALSALHSQGLALARKHFDLTVPDEPGWENWRTEAEGLLVRTFAINAKDVAECGKGRLRYISKQGVGVDNLDQAAMKKHGIALMNTPGINSTAVAELAIALMLDVARLVTMTDRKIRRGDAVTKLNGWTGQTLRGKTLGVIGGGNIGSQCGKMFNAAFGGPIILYDPYIAPKWTTWWKENIPADQLRITDNLDDLLAESDIVTLHCPLWEKSKDLIRLEEIKKMKPTAILVNTARGGVINEDDLAEALEGNLIHGAGVDAFVNEPPRLDQYRRLCENDRCVLIPHFGAACSDVQQDTCLSMVQHLIEAFAGQPLRDRLV